MSENRLRARARHLAQRRVVPHLPLSFRVANHVYAWAFGYFWRPCPLCGRSFGGHEWRDRGGKPSSVPKPGKPGYRSIPTATPKWSGLCRRGITRTAALPLEFRRVPVSAERLK